MGLEKIIEQRSTLVKPVDGIFDPFQQILYSELPEQFNPGTIASKLDFVTKRIDRNLELEAGAFVSDFYPL